MNQASKKYWQSYWIGQEEPSSVTAWQFGVDPDKLAQLVIDGLKTATCSGYVFYEKENEALPKVNDYNIILNSENEPVAITRTVDVAIMPMNEVSEEFAYAEGEGDRSYDYWWREHERFFTEALEEVGQTFRANMLVVCERFELIHSRNL
ncbi:MAG TPA: ASCH domain-containing protein [Pseudogracilibacillus sp.]|nr:ASCH domain-containing protein [Pseudogracilibacillus sp.]